jgi:hypothetical protein
VNLTSPLHSWYFPGSQGPLFSLEFVLCCSTDVDVVPLLQMSAASFLRFPLQLPPPHFGSRRRGASSMPAPASRRIAPRQVHPRPGSSTPRSSSTPPRCFAVLLELPRLNPPSLCSMVAPSPQ